jgi:hypothetical protein
MTEVVENNVAEQQDVSMEIDYKAFYEEHKDVLADYPGLVKKNKELMAETKQAKEEKRRQAEAAEEAKRKQLEVAQKNGEFEKLWKQEQQEKEKVLQELQNSRKERRDEKINLAAMKVAVDLAKGDANKAELLSEFVAKSIGKVADEYGQVDESLLSSVRTQFETDKRYAPLLGGNKSVGSGAQGNTRSASVTTTLDRASFDQLSPKAKAEFAAKVRSGNATLTD